MPGFQPDPVLWMNFCSTASGFRSAGRWKPKPLGPSTEWKRLKAWSKDLVATAFFFNYSPFPVTMLAQLQAVAVSSDEESEEADQGPPPGEEDVGPDSEYEDVEVGESEYSWVLEEAAWVSLPFFFARRWKLTIKTLELFNFRIFWLALEFLFCSLCVRKAALGASVQGKNMRG